MYNRYVFRAAIVLASVTLFGQAAHAQTLTYDPAGRQERAARLRARGQALLEAGDPGSALSYFRDAISVHPGDAPSYAAIGEIYLARGNARYAAEAFAAGLARRADYGPLWVGLARALEEQGLANDAATSLRRFASLQPDNIDAHLARAALAERRGAWNEALASYRIALDLARAGSRTEGVAEMRAKIAALNVLAGETTRADRCTTSSPIIRALRECAL